MVNNSPLNHHLETINGNFQWLCSITSHYQLIIHFPSISQTFAAPPRRPAAAWRCAPPWGPAPGDAPPDADAVQAGHGKIHGISYLVGGPGPPLWKIWTSIGMMNATQYFWENSKNGNHSPPTSRNPQLLLIALHKPPSYYYLVPASTRQRRLLSFVLGKFLAPTGSPNPPNRPLLTTRGGLFDLMVCHKCDI